MYVRRFPPTPPPPSRAWRRTQTHEMASLVRSLLAIPAFRIGIAGAGFFADSYDLFITDGVTSILKNLGPVVKVNYTMPDGSGYLTSYFTAECTDGLACMPRIYNASSRSWVANPSTTFRDEMTPRYQQQTSALKASVNTAALVGSIFGQLFFGFAGDAFGRRLNWVITSALIILGCLGAAASGYGAVLRPTLNAAGLWADTAAVPASSATSVYSQLIFWRVILGFGVGGEYPLSGTISSEGAKSASTRGASVLWTFSMQGWGKLTAAVLNYALVSSTRQFGGRWALDSTWRFAIAFGCVCNIVTIGFRWMMEESHIYTASKEAAADSRGVEVVGGDQAPLFAPRGYVASVSERARDFFVKPLTILSQHRWTIFGTASTWFLIDVTFYGQSLMSVSALALSSDAAVTGARRRPQRPSHPHPPTGSTRRKCSATCWGQRAAETSSKSCRRPCSAPCGRC